MHKNAFFFLDFRNEYVPSLEIYWVYFTLPWCNYRYKYH